jgi:hypothetical protein
MLTSPFSLAAAFITLALFPLWTPCDNWSTLSLSILPNLLGFSVGALAIVLAFPSNPVFKHMAEEGESHSYYMGFVARLVHFVISQFVAIILALFGKAYEFVWVGFFGTLFTVYALCTAVATALSFWGAARIYNEAEAIAEKKMANKVEET